MPAAFWSAQLHIDAGAASEEAPEIAVAERSDARGRGVQLYLLAEPGRPGSERFIEELVTRIGEDFLAATGSITGDLQRILRDRHEDLRDWNRNNLPAEQASYGLSVLIVRGDEAFLGQVGPSLAIVRCGGALQRRRPGAEQSRLPLGLSGPATLEFTRFTLAPGDAVLLLSSAADAAIPEQLTPALERRPPGDLLRLLYPALRALPRVSALVVAPDPDTEGAQRTPAEETEGAQRTTAEETEGDTPGPPEPIPFPARRRTPEAPADAPAGAAPDDAPAGGGTATAPQSDAPAPSTPPADDPPVDRPPAGASDERGAQQRAVAALVASGWRAVVRALGARRGGSAAQAERPPAAPGGREAASDPARDDRPTAPVEYRLDAPPPLRRLRARAVGWPANPFTPPAPPALPSPAEVDAHQTPRPLVGLRATVPRLRRAVRRPLERDRDGNAAPPNWRPVLIASALMLAILAAAAVALLVPDALGDSERERFERSLSEARRGLATAALASDPDAGREDLLLAQAAVAEALALRPEDLDARGIARKIEDAVRQVNAILRPPDLAIVLELGSRAGIPPPIALSAVRIGDDTAYLLDEAGGRVFAQPLAGGEPAAIFRAGDSYPVINQFRGPVAAAPVSMAWGLLNGEGALLILDRDGRLYRYLPAVGVQTLPLPNGDLVGSADALAVSQGALYLLDVAGGRIWRYTVAPDGSLADFAAALPPVDLAGATSLAVAGDLYVTSADGRLRRFSANGEQDFPIVGLDRPLLVPASLGVGTQSRLLYAVDRGNHRVLVLTPSGTLRVQLRDDLLVGVRGTVADEAGGRLYYVTADALLASTMPELPAS